MIEYLAMRTHFAPPKPCIQHAQTFFILVAQRSALHQTDQRVDNTFDLLPI